MMFLERLSALRKAAEYSLWKVQTLGRIGAKVGALDDVHLAGIKVLLREVPRGRLNPSLIFRYQGANEPSRPALLEASSVVSASAADRRFTYAEVDERMERLGSALGRRGLGKGSRALLVLKNRAEFCLIQPALGRIGGSSVTISWRSTPAEIEYVAKHSEVRALFFDVEVAETIKATLSALPPELRENSFVVGGTVPGFKTYDELLESATGPAPDASEEAAVVMYTSGTTGKPKGAVRKFRKDAVASALAFIGETPMVMGERHLVVCPLYHATAFGFAALSFILGSEIVILPDFKPEAFLAAVERYRITTTAVVPTMLHRLVELDPAVTNKYDTSSLKAVFSGGAALSAPLAQAFLDRFGDCLFNFYGATETGLVTLANPFDLRASPGTIGHTIPGNEIRLLDDSGYEVRDGDVGELFVRSALLVEGYHADEAATKSSMRDGFFSVGDLARKDARGCFHIEGRKRDMIISGGVNVYPAEVEQAIEAYPGVSEVAVVGAPDREWGERVRAFVVKKQGAALEVEELRAHCKARLAGPKVPRDFVFLDALPRNPTGKILKRELRTREVVS